MFHVSQIFSATHQLRRMILCIQRRFPTRASQKGPDEPGLCDPEGQEDDSRIAAGETQQHDATWVHNSWVVDTCFCYFLLFSSATLSWIQKKRRLSPVQLAD